MRARGWRGICQEDGGGDILFATGVSGEPHMAPAVDEGKVAAAVLKAAPGKAGINSGLACGMLRNWPADQCGAGVFMANHYDRYYCGKCGLTYVISDKKEESA